MEKNIGLLAFFNFFTDLRFFSAILILYFTNITGSYLSAMSLFAATMIFKAFFEIPTGIFSDFIGRKNTIILGAISSVISVIFYAVGINYWFLFIGALFEGLFLSWYSGNNDALLYESLHSLDKHDHYAHYLGRLSSMFQLALVFGAVIGSILAVWSFAIVMWLSVIPQIICLIISTRLIEPKVLKRKSANIFSHLHLSALKLWQNKILRYLSIKSILGFGIGESNFDFRAAFVNTLWPLWAVGFSKMFSYLGSAISYWFSGKMIKKFGALNIMFVADIYARIINIFSTLLPTVLSPLLMSTTSVFFGVTNVASSKLRQQELTHEQRATVESLNSLLGSLFFGGFAIFLGFIGDKVGPAKALFISQIFLLPNILINWKLIKMEHKNAPSATDSVAEDQLSRL